MTMINDTILEVTGSCTHIGCPHCNIILCKTTRNAKCVGIVEELFKDERHNTICIKCTGCGKDTYLTFMDNKDSILKTFKTSEISNDD